MAEHMRDTGSIPSELAILPLQEAVLFPNTVMPLAVTRIEIDDIQEQIPLDLRL